jgi:hypothetical protein
MEDYEENIFDNNYVIIQLLVMLMKLGHRDRKLVITQREEGLYNIVLSNRYIDEMRNLIFSRNTYNIIKNSSILNDERYLYNIPQINEICLHNYYCAHAPRKIIKNDKKKKKNLEAFTHRAREYQRQRRIHYCFKSSNCNLVLLYV